MANLSEIIWSCEITWQTRQLYLQYHSIYGHHPTVQDSDLVASTHKVNDPLVTWLFKITWQTKTIMALLPHSIWLPNFQVYWLTLSDFYLFIYITRLSRGLARSRKKLKTSLGSVVTYNEELPLIKSHDP